MAIASSACTDLVPRTLPVNPFAKVKTSKARKVRPLLWTAPRVERWQQTGEIPGRVMVWTREQCGAFLDSILVIDQATADALRAWRKAQLAERMAWGSAWTDSGRVFTREDGTPLRPGWVSTRFDTLTDRAKLPPITLHGLLHGAATMLLAAGQPPKVISEVLGHSTVSFTMDVYTEVAEELADSAASAIAAYVPRKSNLAGRATVVPDGGRNDH